MALRVYIWMNICTGIVHPLACSLIDDTRRFGICFVVVVVVVIEERFKWARASKDELDISKD